MRMREVFYSSIALILIGAFVHNEYGGWVMTIGGSTIFGIGIWKIINEIKAGA